jgi:hypothetical protein
MDRTPDRPAHLPSDARPTAGGAAQQAADDAARAAAGRGAGPTAGADADGPDAGRTAVGVAGGAAAGTMAGLQAGALGGAVTLGLGMVAGAALGAAAGAALAQDANPGRFTDESDAHYRALYEGAGDADGAGGYDAVRPAYVFGHVAAAEPELAGHTFEQAEPALERAWNDELRARAGEWPRARRYARDAFGHARAEGAGARRDAGVVGSGGSAVDPVELDRARHGLPSAGA